MINSIVVMYINGKRDVHHVCAIAAGQQPWPWKYGYTCHVCSKLPHRITSHTKSCGVDVAACSTGCHVGPIGSY